MTHEPLRVIGIGDRPAGRTLPQPTLLPLPCVEATPLDFFPAFTGTRIVIDADRDRWLGALRDIYRRQKTVVLASGDPLFYGVGRMLLDAIPREDLIFEPHVSSVQLAFARLKEPWHDARIVSLHGRPIDCLLPALEERAAKIAILTDGQSHLAAIASLLCERQLDHAYEFAVCENLGGTEERVTRGSARELGERTFSPLNVVVLLRDPAAPSVEPPLPLLGLSEETLQHQGDPPVA